MVTVQREYLSPNEIAELLGVSPFTIRRYIKLGELRAVKLLGGFRVHRDDLQRFLKAHEVNSAEEELSSEEVAADKAAPHSKTKSEDVRDPANKPNGLPRLRANHGPVGVADPGAASGADPGTLRAKANSAKPPTTERRVSSVSPQVPLTKHRRASGRKPRHIRH